MEYIDMCMFLTVAGLAPLLERLTAERRVTGSIPGTEPTLRVLKWMRNEDTAFALQMARPSRASVPPPRRDVKNSVPNQYFRAKYVDTEIKFFVIINRSTASWPLEPPSDPEGWRYVRLQQAGKNASGQTHYLSLSGFELYGTVLAAVEEPLG